MHSQLSKDVKSDFSEFPVKKYASLQMQVTRFEHEHDT